MGFAKQPPIRCGSNNTPTKSHPFTEGKSLCKLFLLFEKIASSFTKFVSFLIDLTLFRKNHNGFDTHRLPTPAESAPFASMRRDRRRPSSMQPTVIEASGQRSHPESDLTTAEGNGCIFAFPPSPRSAFRRWPYRPGGLARRAKWHVVAPRSCHVLEASLTHSRGLLSANEQRYARRRCWFYDALSLPRF